MLKIKLFPEGTAKPVVITGQNMDDALIELAHVAPNEITSGTLVIEDDEVELSQREITHAGSER